MTKSERIARKISTKIKLWNPKNSKLVVVLDGYAGSGKTTVAKNLSKINKDIAVIHLDDFIKHWKIRKKLIEKSLDKSKVFELHWYRYKKLGQIIKIFKKKHVGYLETDVYDFKKNDFGKILKLDLSKKILIIEGIFLLHPKGVLNGLIDKKIYLDSDHSRSDKRRRMRDRKEFSKKYISDDDPDSWIKYYKLAYKKYIKIHKPDSRADLVFKI